ncbi:MAG: hypothetical protein ACRDGK_03740 [Actinomycetota bacterium]
MSLLRRALGAGALVSLLLCAPMVAIPRTLVEGSMGQAPGGDVVWVRLFGTAIFALGLVHVLILRKLDELWWWCWAFVVFDGAAAAIALSHAAIGLPDGSAAWPWWVFGGITATFTVVYLAGLAKAGQEKPFA